MDEGGGPHPSAITTGSRSPSSKALLDLQALKPKADRKTVGFLHLSQRKFAYHHLAGVNLPAACSMA